MRNHPTYTATDLLPDDPYLAALALHNRAGDLRPRNRTQEIKGLKGNLDNGKTIREIQREEFEAREEENRLFDEALEDI